MIGENISARRVARRLVTATITIFALGGDCARVNAEGYLSRLGPVGLLYKAPAPTFAALLPPLLMHDKPEPAAKLDPEADAKKTPTNNPMATRLAGLLTATNAPMTTPQVIEEPAAPPLFNEPPKPNTPTQEFVGPPAMPPITPQMLIRFFDFQNGTNHHGSLAVPFIFTPPLPPGPARSSTATYIKE